MIKTQSRTRFYHVISIINFLCFSSEVLEAIENVIQDVLKSLAQKKAPVLTLANRSDWRNIE